MRVLLILLSLLVFQEDEPLGLDETRTVMLEDGPVRVIIEADAGDVVTIQVEGPADDDDPLNDPVVTVIGPDGDQVAYNDNHGTERDDLRPVDALIEALVLPEAGDYVVVVDTYGGIYSGELRVTLTEADRFNAQITETDDEIVITGDLPAFAAYTYTFSAEEPVTITARDTSRTLDPVLTLRDASGDVIARNDDHGTDDLTLDAFDARIDADAPGEVTLVLTDFTGASGAFEVVIRR